MCNNQTAGSKRIFPVDDHLAIYQLGGTFGVQKDGKILTPANYVNDLYVINSSYGIVCKFSPVPHYNYRVLISLETGEEVIPPNFHAFTIHDDYLAFRVDGDDGEKNWGIFSLAIGEELFAPMLELEQMYTQIAELCS